MENAGRLLVGIGSRRGEADQKSRGKEPAGASLDHLVGAGEDRSRAPPSSTVKLRRRISPP